MRAKSVSAWAFDFGLVSTKWMDRPGGNPKCGQRPHGFKKNYIYIYMKTKVLFANLFFLALIKKNMLLALSQIQSNFQLSNHHPNICGKGLKGVNLWEILHPRNERCSHKVGCISLNLSRIGIPQTTKNHSLIPYEALRTETWRYCLFWKAAWGGVPFIDLR